MNLLPAIAATGLCVLATGVLVVAERRRWRVVRAVAKTTAAVAFVAVALTLDAAESAYGRWILAALLLGLLGDVLLLSDRGGAFGAGLGAFLLSHLAFTVAFLGRPFPAGLVAAAGLGVALAWILVLRWLWPHLGRPWRVPVMAYVATIGAMCVAAFAHAGGGGAVWVPAAALLFAASDVAVARERFVVSGFGNAAFGLPAYFAAQLGLAWSVWTG